MNSRLLAAGSCALSGIASAYLLAAPSYSGVSMSSSTDGTTHAVTFNKTLLETNGTRVLPLLIFPVVVSALTLLVPRRRPRIARALLVTAGFLLLAFVLFGAFSIGLYYFPATGVMFLAAGAVEQLQASDTRET